MAFNGAYTVSQGNDPTKFTITDTSTGSDPNITDRRISLFKDDGTTLVPEGSATTYIDFPLSMGNSITIDLLDVDMALNIQVVWISSSPIPGSVYSVTELTLFKGNNETYYSYLTRLQRSNPLLINNKNFYYNKMKLRVDLDTAVQAVGLMNDIVNAQAALNSATQLTQNGQYYFS